MSDFNVDWDGLKTAKIENGDMVALGKDAEFFAEFHMAKVPNFDGTDFEEVPHLRLQAPGNTRCVYDQPVRLDSHPSRPSDPERFPREWAAFQNGQDSNAEGTSLYAWPDVTPADARRFDLHGIKTVEQLAKVSDSNLQDLGVGALALRDRARLHLTGNTENSQLRDQVNKLTDIVNALLGDRAASEEQPEEPQRRGPGRPRNTEKESA